MFINSDFTTNSPLTAIASCLGSYKDRFAATLIANVINGPISNGNLFQMIGVLKFSKPAGLTNLVDCFPVSAQNLKFEEWIRPKQIAGNGSLAFIGSIILGEANTKDWDGKIVTTYWTYLDGSGTWVVSNASYQTSPLFSAMSSNDVIAGDFTFAGNFVWFGQPSP